LKNTDGRSKGIAFVRFNTEDSVAAAVEMSGMEHMGRSLIIEKTKPREARPQNTGGASNGGDTESTTCFIGNLAFGTVEDSLRDAFQSCGDIKDVRVARDQEGNSRGFGYVEFYDNACV